MGFGTGILSDPICKKGLFITGIFILQGRDKRMKYNVFSFYNQVRTGRSLLLFRASRRTQKRVLENFIKCLEILALSLLAEKDTLNLHYKKPQGMKKLSVLLITGVTVALASCGGENTAGTAPSQAQIDSMVNARVEELRIEMEAKNDSIINSLAQIKADSMIAAMKGTAPTASNVSRPKPTTKPTKPVTVPTKSDKQDKLDRMSGNDETKKVTPQQTEEKKGKLDRMR